MNTIRKKINILWCIVRASTRIFIKTKSVQSVVNSLFYDKNKLLIESPEFFDYVVMKDGNKYYMSRLINGVTQAQQDYIFDGIQKEDIVIDIGASIGGFTIPSSKKAKFVYAVEPMTLNMLRKNTLLNKRENIEVLEIALGDGNATTIEWLGETKTVETKTLTEIKNICGGCDFLKIDCEGCEWNIKPEELNGIRGIEMEVHKVGISFSIMKERLREAGFGFKVENHPEGNIGLLGIHARRTWK